MSSTWSAIDRIILAEHLRRYASISKLKYQQQKADISAHAHLELEEQKKTFIESEYLETDFLALEVKILDVAKQGDYEVEVMRFPAYFCTDGGRSINNFEARWPETLQGKARGFYLVWKQHAQAKGYRLKAKIINYPKGFMGDLGLYIDWS